MLISELSPYELAIVPPPRVACMKCGRALWTPPEANVGSGAWCRVCRKLLHMSFGGPLAADELDALGLAPSFAQRQAAERIPTVRRVEQWYEVPDEPEAETFDRIFRAALGDAA